METRRWNTVQVLLFVVVLVLAVAALRAGRAFFIPFTLSLFLAALFWPMHTAITRRTHRAVSITAILLVVLALVGLLGGAVWITVDRVSRELAESSDELWAAYGNIRSHLGESGLDVGWLPEASQQAGQGQAGPEPAQNGRVRSAPADGAPQAVAPQRTPEPLSGLSPRAASVVLSFITSGLGSLGWVVAVVGLSIFMMVLLLLEIPRWRERLDALAGKQAAASVSETLGEISYQVRRYLLFKTITGAISGVLVALWCWAMGVSFPVTWGLLQFLFNYVPNVGSFISGIPPTLLAFVEIGLWQGIVFGLGLIVIETLIGNVLDPLLEGNALRLSPFVVLASLIFWGWIWGAIGTLLSVPIAAALVSIMLHTPRLRPLGEFVRDYGHSRRKKPAH